METLLFLKSHWLIIAFLAPMSWALVNIIDVYFVGNIYKDELDGTIISGLFQILPWPIIMLLTDFGPKQILELNTEASTTVFLSFLSGILYSASFFFYFKALFKKNDVSLLQILWNLTIIAVPVLSFLLFKETLPLIKYIGMAVVLFGATILSFDTQIKKHFSKKYFGIMLGAVLFLSASMILQGQTYNWFFETYGQNGFWYGFFFFSLGAFFTGLSLTLLRRRNPLEMIKKFYKVFILAEGIYFLGSLASQKALDISPSASFVAVVETFVPVFVLVYSLIILLFLTMTKKKNEIVKQIYLEQTHGIGLKILAALVMAIGVYIIS